MIALVVGTIVLLIASNGILQLYQEKARADFTLALTEIRLELQNALLKSQNWDATKSHDPQMACFNGAVSSSCTLIGALGPQNMKLYSNDGTVIYDSTNALTGFTKTGSPCSTFGTTPDCILKPNLKWRVECNVAVDPTCQSPLIMIELKYSYTGTHAGSMNFDNYGFRLTKTTFPLKVSWPCPTLEPTCATPSQAAICEAGVWVCREFGP